MKKENHKGNKVAQRFFKILCTTFFASPFVSKQKNIINKNNQKNLKV
jgi:hypothetical protein